MAFLTIEHANKGYGSPWKRSEVLHDINLSVERGEFVAVVGFSGAGKTTLINLLAGLVQSDNGTVTMDGKPITGPGPERGLVFQNYSLLPWLTVSENIALAVDQVFPQWNATQRREQVERFIKLVILVPARNKLPRELSGGMRQRVSVARTLAIDPQVLLLDEPLSALDALTRATLQDEITDIRRQDDKTIILITNDPDEALLLADRVIPLSAGPKATLLESITVTLPRPRDRKALLDDPEFKRLRNEIVDRLMESKRKPAAALTRKLVLPDIQPEDISLVRSRFRLGVKRPPKRPNEVKPVKVEVEA